MASYTSIILDDAFITKYRCVDCGCVVTAEGTHDHDTFHEKIRQATEKVNRLERIHMLDEPDRDHTKDEPHA